ADAAYAVNLHAGRSELAPQAGNMGIERIRSDIVVEPIDGLFERIARDGPPGAVYQGLKGQELPPRQLDRLAVDLDLAVFGFKLDATDRQRLVLDLGRPAQNGA